MNQVISMKRAQQLQVASVTVKMATELLEFNKCNRPVSQQHVNRIAKAIAENRWHFNGDTIKISDTKEILDGQHRLWAIIESGQPVETIIVRGIKPEAFATIDTIRKTRSGSDVLSVKGLNRHCKTVSQALMWLKRYQMGAVKRHRAPENRVENSDVEAMYAAHPQMVDAAEQTKHCRRVITSSLVTFLYYVFSNKDGELADSFIKNLENPAGLSAEHPFFLYREWLLQQKLTAGHRDPVAMLAMGVKAWNAVRGRKRIKRLTWRAGGPKAEAFPTIE